MTEDERCRHPDCIYRNRADPDKSGNCSYMIIEGRSRTARLPERLRLPVNCPFYKPDGVTPPEPEKRWDWRNEAWKLYRAGATDREIADRLHLGVTTVRYHVNNLIGKTGYSSRTELAVNAVRSGITTPGISG